MVEASKAFKVHIKTWQNNNWCLSGLFVFFFFFCLFLQQVVIIYLFFLSQATLDKTPYLIAKKLDKKKCPEKYLLNLDTASSFGLFACYSS